MNTLVSCDIQPDAPTGWRVWVYVDGNSVAIHGSFKEWDDAHAAARNITERVVAAATKAAEQQLST